MSLLNELLNTDSEQPKTSVSRKNFLQTMAVGVAGSVVASCQNTQTA